MGVLTKYDPIEPIYLPQSDVTYCDGMPESRNSGTGSKVDFLGNEFLSRLHDNS
jgi:hypothetical protein